MQERIVVIGTSGSGKTTLARRLAHKLNIPHIELDAINWQNDWRELSNDDLAQRLQPEISQDSWIIDGNYSRVRPLIWARATMIVWLDYSRWVIMRRVIRRSLKRTLTRETLWGTNNRETWSKLLSRDSLIAWVWTTYASSKQRYTELLVQPEYQHLRIVHLRTPREAEQWLNQSRFRS